MWLVQIPPQHSIRPWAMRLAPLACYVECLQLLETPSETTSCWVRMKRQTKTLQRWSDKLPPVLERFPRRETVSRTAH